MEPTRRGVLDLYSLLQLLPRVCLVAWANRGKKTEFPIDVWLNLSDDHSESPSLYVTFFRHRVTTFLLPGHHVGMPGSSSVAHDINYTIAFNTPKAMRLPGGRISEKEEKLEAACMCNTCEKERLRNPATWRVV